MSNTNYDVAIDIKYNNTYRHYIPTYAVAVPSYQSVDKNKGDGWFIDFYERKRNNHVVISFDNDSEQEIEYYWNYRSSYKERCLPPSPLYNDSTGWGTTRARKGTYQNGTEDPANINASGVHSKVYFRNPRRNQVTFNASNCFLRIGYLSKAAFEIQLNSSGYIPYQNPSFKCSTVEKPIPVQYSWSSAKVFYKKSTDSSYSSANASLSGTWSDMTVTANITLPTGYTYNIYIQATADDGTVATTGVNNFATTDGEAVATCISPAGVYTNGTINFVWSHSTAYGTKQYAYDLQYSANNGGTWVTVANHVVSSVNNRTITINTAGVYIWRVRTYNSMNQAGAWAQASFINNIPAATPTNLTVTTKGRPTVSWVSTTQAAYQVQVLLNNTIVYDSGAVYTGENKHFINNYFDDSRAYKVRVRIYNSLGSVSNWAQTGYQQPAQIDVEFTLEQLEDGGTLIKVSSTEFMKYYVKRNDVVIGEIKDGNTSYKDKFAIGITRYAVVGVTVDEQCDIKEKDIRIAYPCASLVTMAGVQYAINKRVNEALEISVSNEADVNKAKFIGDDKPTHYFNKMKLKSFTVTCFDDNDIVDELLGTVVFYADNFGNGGYCIVANYERSENFIKNSRGVYANEVSLTLEVTNYDDSIKYEL